MARLTATCADLSDRILSSPEDNYPYHLSQPIKQAEISANPIQQAKIPAQPVKFDFDQLRACSLHQQRYDYHCGPGSSNNDQSRDSAHTHKSLLQDNLHKQYINTQIGVSGSVVSVIAHVRAWCFKLDEYSYRFLHKSLSLSLSVSLSISHSLPLSLSGYFILCLVSLSLFLSISVVIFLSVSISFSLSRYFSLCLVPLSLFLYLSL